MLSLTEIKKNIVATEYKNSISNLLKLQKENKNNIEIIYLLAICFDKLGDYKNAIDNYKAVILKKPRDIYLNNLGKIFIKKNEFKKAITYFNKSLDLNLKNPETYNLIGICYGMLNEENLAINFFNKSLDCKSDYIDTIYNLLELFEKTNKINELQKLINKKIIHFPKNKIILFYNSYVLEKENKSIQAIKILSKINFSTINAEWVVKSKYRIAELLNKVKNYKESFNYYREANNIVLKNIPKQSFVNNNFLNELNFEIANYKRTLIKNPIVTTNELSLIFHIGFPRSGTTLIDAILNTHSNTLVIEEVPVIDSIFKNQNFIDSTSSLKKQRVAISIYQEFLSKHYLQADLVGKTIIDKLPLNLVKIKKINEIFPQAKFIVSIRHPLDCILSCYMQNFQLNSSMINFLDLERTAIVYDKVMYIWKQNQNELKKISHIIKYENLIQNFNTEIEKLLIFLSLKNENIENNYRNEVLKRERVRTPSYNQITQPIYKSSINKWHNFKDELSEIRPIVEKWVNFFEYDLK